MKIFIKLRKFIYLFSDITLESSLSAKAGACGPGQGGETLLLVLSRLQKPGSKPRSWKRAVMIRTPLHLPLSRCTSSQPRLTSGRFIGELPRPAHPYSCFASSNKLPLKLPQIFCPLLGRQTYLPTSSQSITWLPLTWCWKSLQVLQCVTVEFMTIQRRVPLSPRSSRSVFN